MENRPIRHRCDMQLMGIEAHHVSSRVDEYGAVHVTLGQGTGAYLTLNFAGDTTLARAETLRAVAERLYAVAADVIDDERRAAMVKLPMDEVQS